jgi:plasmid maintenance system antidote protein VapI
MDRKTPSSQNQMSLRECIERVTTLDTLAAHISEQKEKILDICNGKGFATPLMAMKIGRALSVNPELWLNLDSFYDLNAIAEEKYNFVTPLAH